MKTFIIGLSIGLILSSLLFYVLTQRYSIYAVPPATAIKVDTWSGKSWIKIYFTDVKRHAWVIIEDAETIVEKVTLDDMLKDKPTSGRIIDEKDIIFDPGGAIKKESTKDIKK